MSHWNYMIAKMVIKLNEVCKHAHVGDMKNENGPKCRRGDRHMLIKGVQLMLISHLFFMPATTRE